MQDSLLIAVSEVALGVRWEEAELGLFSPEEGGESHSDLKLLVIWPWAKLSGQNLLTAVGLLFLDFLLFGTLSGFEASNIGCRIRRLALMNLKQHTVYYKACFSFAVRQVGLEMTRSRLQIEGRREREK